MSDSRQRMSNRASASVTICNSKGLHARASATFVKCAEAFESKIDVTKDGQTVGGTSIMGLMMLAASPGSEIQISAQGPDANQAVTSLTSLIALRFGEDT